MNENESESRETVADNEAAISGQALRASDGGRRREVKEWKFAKELDGRIDPATIPSPYNLCRAALNSRESKQRILQDALNAALENLMSWERVARAWGFEVEVCTDTGLGTPQPVFEDGTVYFVQFYGVMVARSKGRWRTVRMIPIMSPEERNCSNCPERFQCEMEKERLSAKGILFLCPYWSKGEKDAARKFSRLEGVAT